MIEGSNILIVDKTMQNDFKIYVKKKGLNNPIYHYAFNDTSG